MDETEPGVAAPPRRAKRAVDPFAVIDGAGAAAPFVLFPLSWWLDSVGYGFIGAIAAIVGVIAIITCWNLPGLAQNPHNAQNPVSALRAAPRGSDATRGRERQGLAAEVPAIS